MNKIRLPQSPSLFLLICLLGFPQISETIYTPALPNLAQSLKVSMSEAEFTLSVYFIGFAVGVFIWGLLADKIGRRKPLLIGLVLYTFCSWQCWMSDSYSHFCFFRFIQGIGASVGSVITQTIIRDLYFGQKRAQIFSILGAALALSPALGPFIGGGLSQYLGWRSNFTLLTMMGGSLWCFSWLRLPETQKRNSHTTYGVKAPNEIDLSIFKLFKTMALDLNVLRYSLLIAACNGILFSYYAEGPSVFIELARLSPSQYGCLGVVVAIPILLASKISHQLVIKYDSEKIILLGAFILLLGSALLVGSTFDTDILNRTALLGRLLFPISVIFMGIGLIIPNCLSNALSHYQKQSGAAGSILGLSNYIQIAVFTAGMGYFHNGTLQAMPLYFLTIALLILVLSFFNSRSGGLLKRM